MHMAAFAGWGRVQRRQRDEAVVPRLRMPLSAATLPSSFWLGMTLTCCRSSLWGRRRCPAWCYRASWAGVRRVFGGLGVGEGR